jgi:hypothetical protein
LSGRNGDLPILTSLLRKKEELFGELRQRGSCGATAKEQPHWPARSARSCLHNRGIAAKIM